MTLDGKALCYGKNLKQEREGIRIRAAETGIRIQIITEFLTCGLNNRASLPVGAHPELGPGAVLVQIKKISDEIVISPLKAGKSLKKMSFVYRLEHFQGYVLSR